MVGLFCAVSEEGEQQPAAADLQMTKKRFAKPMYGFSPMSTMRLGVPQALGNAGAAFELRAARRRVGECGGKVVGLLTPCQYSATLWRGSCTRRLSQALRAQRRRGAARVRAG